MVKVVSSEKPLSPQLRGYSMRIKRDAILFLALWLAACLAHGQDSPSLGDLARQQRQQKAADAKDGKTPKVITNEQLPEHAAKPASQATTDQDSTENGEKDDSSPKDKAQGEHLREQILAEKNQVGSLQKELDDLNESIRFAPANCVSNCAEWNQRQREKQEHVEQMKGQLEEEKKRLEDMQESARKQGFGSSVYEP
jgi:hypothetical protein